MGVGGLLSCRLTASAPALPYALQTGAAAGPAPTFVKTHTRQRLADNPTIAAAISAASSSSSSKACMYDVIVAGGTLGVFVAVALAQRGLSVAVVERGVLAGRTQEWNISRKELLELVEVREVFFFGGGAVWEGEGEERMAGCWWGMLGVSAVRCGCVMLSHSSIHVTPAAIIP